MGWCSGTEIFDTVCEVVLDCPAITEDKQKHTIEELYLMLSDHDWDCQADSDYIKHPIVQAIVKKHDDWYEDE